MEKIQEVELWKMRAMIAERKSLMAETAIMKMKYEQLNDEIDLFEATLREKYKCADGDDIDREGNIIRKEEVGEE